MARIDGSNTADDAIEPGEEPTAIATAPATDPGVGGERAPLWSGSAPGEGEPAATTDADDAVDADAESQAESGQPDGDEARRQVNAALAKVTAAKERAGEQLAGAKATAGEKAADAKDKAGSKAGDARQRVGALAAGARERASGADVKELAASTTSLIDTARPFFLAFFGGLFTLLAFIEGDSGTSQLFVVGAILFVLAAGFSDELGHLMPRRRREGDE